MKFLAHLASRRVVVSRLVSVGGYRKAYSTVTTAEVARQPLSAERSNLYNGVVGKSHIMYCDNGLDISEGDRLRDIDTGQVYKVATGGVSNRSFGSIDYQEVVIEEIGNDPN